VAIEIRDLQALKLACQALGLQFRENQRTYRWYGRYMGDSQLPAGFTPEELGRCEHAISVPGNRYAYEVGVLRRRDGKPGFALYYDNWQGGGGLEERIGENARRLKQEYASQVATRQLRRQGFRVVRQLSADGRILLKGVK